MVAMQPLRHIYNNPTLDRDVVIRKLVLFKTKGYLTSEELEYLKHLIRKENDHAQRANGCTY